MYRHIPAVTRLLAVLASAAALTGCASAPSADPRDPFEAYNRSMTRFNDALDDAIVRPVATAYRDVLPQPVRTGVGNFFGNLSDVWSFVNNVLQAKPEGALSSFWRVVINTTMGLGGVLDPASEMRLERHREDFGQTLGYWGLPAGPYLVLPLLGGSTLRDATALPVDWYGRPQTYISETATSVSVNVLNMVHLRSTLLGASSVLEAAALDSYTFRRDAHLQRRAYEVHDGNPPQDEERYDIDLDEPAPAAPAPPVSHVLPAEPQTTARADAPAEPPSAEALVATTPAEMPLKASAEPWISSRPESETDTLPTGHAAPARQAERPHQAHNL